MRELHCLTVILAAGLLVGFLPACGVASAHMISHRVPGQSGKETKQRPDGSQDPGDVEARGHLRDLPA